MPNRISYPYQLKESISNQGEYVVNFNFIQILQVQSVSKQCRT